MRCHENVHTELNVFAIQTIFANVNTCIENTKFAVGMKSIFRYVHDLDEFLIDLFTVWSEDTWLQEYAGKTADKKSTEDPEGETEKSVVSSMVTCRSVRPNNECLKKN